MEPWIQMILTILGSVLASSGFWAYMTKRSDRNTAEKDLLIGLAHDRIMAAGETYIRRGYVTSEEYENFYEYLYGPYEKAGGNGSAKHMMNEVDKLPVRPHEIATA